MLPTSQTLQYNLMHRVKSDFAIFCSIPLWSVAPCYLHSVFGVIVTVILLLLQQKPRLGTSGFAHGPFTARMQDMGSWPALRVVGFGSEVFQPIEYSFFIPAGP